MENHDQNQEEEEAVVYLKVNFDSCRFSESCNNCPKILERKLKKMKGVSKVIVDRKKNTVMIVTVTSINPMIIVEKIKDMGKNAEIFNPFGDDDDESTRSTFKTSKEGSSSSNGHQTVRSRGKTHKMMHHDCRHETSRSETSENDSRSSSRSIRGCNDISSDHKSVRGRNHRLGKTIKEEHVCEPCEIPLNLGYVGMKKDDHVYESYEKPVINKLICSDFYCKLHAQKGLISSKVPSIDSEDHPCHTNGFLDELRGMQGNSLFEQNVPLEYFPQRNPPFSGYGPYPTSIMPRNHDYTYSGIGPAYSRQAMPFSGYDEHNSYPTGMPMPGYNDHNNFSGRVMPFNGCGNQYR